MSSIHITPCQPEEVPILRQMAESTFVKAFGAQNTPEDMAEYTAKAFSLATVQQEFDQPDSYFFFAKEGDRPIAYLKINFNQAQSDLREANGMEIERIYVEAGYQGRGIGAQLFDYAWDIALQRAMSYVWLGVWDRNPGAIRFYERQGFQAFSKHTFHLGQDLQTDILMRREVLNADQTK
ncbi:MAG: GNAT family N-acetyltransferase [Saprospiraceae bacterium]|nr:GNAT family N-acetyltransferase [Saprospiraceae bacterium]